jgi:hypothetical protein
VMVRCVGIMYLLVCPAFPLVFLVGPCPAGWSGQAGVENGCLIGFVTHFSSNLLWKFDI